MLLLTINYNGETVRCSTETRPLEHQWHGVVSRIDPIIVRSNFDFGGYLRVSMPTVRFTPALFDPAEGLISVFPPPKTLLAVVAATDSDEASAETLCSGTLVRTRWSEKEIVYTLYSNPYLPIPGAREELSVQYSANKSSWHSSYQNGDLYLRTSTDGATWSGSVQFVMPGGTSLASWGPTTNLVTGFFTRLCTELGLTLDSTHAMASPPVVTGTVSGNSLLLDVADGVAAYFGLFFWIDPESMTLHLVDNVAETGTPIDYGRFGFVRTPVYTDMVPVNTVSDGTGFVYTVGESTFGQEVSAGQGLYATDNRYLKKIADYLAKQQIEFTVPESYGVFQCGRKASFIESRTPVEVGAEMLMRSVQYDLQSKKTTLIGEGVIA